jgi:hypothetical protein
VPRGKDLQDAAHLEGRLPSRPAPAAALGLRMPLVPLVFGSAAEGTLRPLPRWVRASPAASAATPATAPAAPPGRASARTFASATAHPTWLTQTSS